MKLIIEPRRSGSTKRLAEYVKNDENSYFVTHSREEADRVSREFEIPKERCITHDQLISATGLDPRRRNPRIYVDNFDKLMLRLLHPRIVDLCEVVIKWPEDK